MWVKICANTNLADAALAAELGADAVGFVFASSRRQVTAAQVAEIAAGLPDAVERVGVFTTGDAGEILATAEQAMLTGVQLHREFDRALVRRLVEASEGRLRLIQAVMYEVDAVDGEDAAARFEAALREAMGEPGVAAVLLDAERAGSSGGLGVAFPWERARGAIERVRAGLRAGAEPGGPPKVILAGGLNGGNVAGAIALLRPDGVDVASGVEAEPGRKDLGRLRAFLEAARGAEAS